MKTSIFLLVSLCGFWLLAGCTGGSTTPPATIAVQMSPGAAQAIDVGQSVSITADVIGDSSNQGVDWTITCPVGVNACGSMAQNKTASGAPNTFTAPTNASTALTANVTATSLSAPTQSKSLAVTVNPALSVVNPPPVQPQSAVAGQPYSLNLMKFVQGGTPPFTWSVTSGALPAGLSLNASTGMISGTPSTPGAGTTFSVNCTDSGNPPTSLSGSLEFSVATNPQGLLTITSGTPPGGAVGVPYGGTHIISGHSFTGFPMTAIGGTPTYTWSWAAAQGSTLPPGLTLSSFYVSGGSTRCCVYVIAIAGNPTTAGTYNVIVTLTDSASPAAKVSANYTIGIRAAPANALAINSGTPPNGTIGLSYDQKITGYCQPIGQGCYTCFLGGSTRICDGGYRTLYSDGFVLSATGGVPPYTWTWAAATNSSLPAGLNLSPTGTITGKPTSLGSFGVIVMVTDSGARAAVATESYTINIGNQSASAAIAKGAVASVKGHVRFKLVDVGTIGGSNSNTALPFIEGLGAPSLSQTGVFAGQAETSTPDPFAPNCFSPDCFVTHAIKWDRGVITDLGALAGPAGLSSTATWISNSGLISGISLNGVIDPFTGTPATHGVVWNRKGIIDLGVLKGGYESVAIEINGYGEIAGFANNDVPDPNSLAGLGTQTRAVIWRNGNIRDLGTLGGSDAVALYVNELGQVVGESYTADSVPPPSPSCTDSPLTQHGFFWENGKMTDLDTLGGSCTFVYALNNRGQIVGQSTLAGDNTSHPFVWQKGTMKDLGALGGNYGYAGWLNDAGEVVGSASNQGEQALLAFLWKDGAMANLGVLNGNSCSVANAINSNGQVVGGSGVYLAPIFPTCTDAVEHAVLWENGQALDLNLLVTSTVDLTLNEATSLNDRGEISGFGTLANGDTHAFVLIPCDPNHPSVEGCDYSLVDNSPASSLEAPRAEAPTTLRPANANASIRALLMDRMRRFGLRSPQP